MSAQFSRKATPESWEQSICSRTNSSFTAVTTACTGMPSSRFFHVVSAFFSMSDFYRSLLRATPAFSDSS